jgi:hypothetical protein
MSEKEQRKSLSRVVFLFILSVYKVFLEGKGTIVVQKRT